MRVLHAVRSPVHEPRDQRIEGIGMRRGLVGVDELMEYQFVTDQSDRVSAHTAIAPDMELRPRPV